MLELYGAIGRRLYRVRRLLWTFVALSLLIFLGLSFWAGPSEDQTYELTSLVLLLWTLSLVVVAETFAAPPPVVDPQARFMARLRARISRGIRWVMTLTTTALLVLVILLSFRAAGLLMRG